MGCDRQPQGVPHPHADVVVPLLPSPPTRVLEIGCGPEGGFVPTLLARGDDAVGVDPNAPDGPAYHRVPLEDLDDPGPLDAVVASVSLHHVADLAVVLDRVAGWLAPAGTLVVLEWSWERFDTTAATWCFDRLPEAPTPDAPDHGHDQGGRRDHGHWDHGHRDHGDKGHGSDAHGHHDHGHDHDHGDGGPPEPGAWLRRHRDGWRASGLAWDDYLRSWAETGGLHRGSTILAALDERFRRDHLVTVPYFFPDLPGTTAADEQAALDAGRIPGSAFLFRGRSRPI